MNNIMTIEEILKKQAKRKVKGPYSNTHQHVNAFKSSSIGLILQGLAKYADDYSHNSSPALDEHWIESLKLVRGLLVGNIGPYLNSKFCLEIISALALKNGFSNNDLFFVDRY